MQGICNYIPEINHVFRVYSFAYRLYLQIVVHVMLFSTLSVLYFYFSTFRRMRAVPSIADFFRCVFAVFCCGMFWMILRWFQLSLLPASLLFLHSTCAVYLFEDFYIIIIIIIYYWAIVWNIRGLMTYMTYHSTRIEKNLLFHDIICTKF
jgi:hypothetical protein